MGCGRPSVPGAGRAFQIAPATRDRRKRVETPLLVVDRILQAPQPLGFNLVGDLAAQSRAGRARPLAVFERVGIARSRSSRTRSSVAAKSSSLSPGKADDEVRGQRDIGPRRAQAIDDAPIVVDRVAAVHRFEHAIGARLHRQMEKRHQRGDVAMGGDQLVAHIARMRGGVANTCQAGEFGRARGRAGRAPTRRHRARRRDRR